MPRPAPPSALIVLLAALLLGGCDRLGLPDPAKTEAQAEADGKAIGSACRHAGRAIEDCFTLNQSAQKAAVFAGWKEMNDYMVENKISEVAPVLPPPAPPAAAGKPAKKGKADAAAETADSAEGGDAPAAETPRKRRSRAAD